MASKYFISLRPQANDSHAVHKEGCPLLSGPGERIFLGIFQSPHEAIEEGKNHFCTPCSCRFCSNEYYEDHKKNPFSDMPEKPDFLSSDRVRDSWESALICSMN